MMIGGLRHIAWDDPTEAIPAFLTIIMMPLAVSITEGVAFGVIAYVDPEAGDRPRPRGASADVRLRRLLFVASATLFLALTRAGDRAGVASDDAMIDVAQAAGA